eukprot:3776214-Amphidinium_carterae.1
MERPKARATHSKPSAMMIHEGACEMLNTLIGTPSLISSVEALKNAGLERPKVMSELHSHQAGKCHDHCVPDIAILRRVGEEH